MADDSEVQDLIIIKRRLSTELETPKGGVWKIAFADFMTAMMCFFLVMWLINAANEDTRQAVASYFNPVRLAELNKKGLEKPHIPPDNQPVEGERTREESTPGNAAPAAATSAEPSDVSRDAMFKDPYRILSEIAGEPGPAGGASNGGGGVDLAAAAAGPFRDPFDPEFLKEAPGTGAFDTAAGQAPSTSPIEDDGTALAGPLRLSLPPGEPLPAAGGVPMSPKTTARAPVAPPPPADADDRSSRSELAAELAEAVEEETGGNKSPSVAVEETGEGVMISLTDDADFGMFDIGSAQPQPQMIRIMERIAAILKARSGSITVRGHTDARPFRTAAYDNWRLSTDRAQMAYYMLVRGGLDEKRVEAIEGYADRKLKMPGDPEAAQNRRIEILLREVSL